MSRRVRVTIDRIVVEGGGVPDAAAFRGEIERQVALRLAAPGATRGLSGQHVAKVEAAPVQAAGDARGVAGAIAGAIVGGGGR